MAKTSFIVYCIWMLLVIASTVRVAEGSRYLMLRDKNEDSKRHAAVETDDQQLAPQAPTQVVNAAQPPPPPSSSHAVDTFRPTNPGHSPGAGHSMQLKTSSVQIVRDYHKTVSNDNAPSTVADATVPPVPPPTRGADDFTPTVPGHSPGAGHSVQN